MHGVPADFPAWVISSSLRCSLFNKSNNIEFTVYTAPPRPFICLLFLLSCGFVIAGTCLWTRTVSDRTRAIESCRGADQMLCQNLWRAKIMWLCFCFTDFALAYQKKQSHVWLRERFISGKTSFQCFDVDEQKRGTELTFFMLYIAECTTSIASWNVCTFIHLYRLCLLLQSPAIFGKYHIR